MPCFTFVTLPHSIPKSVHYSTEAAYNRGSTTSMINYP